MSQVIISVDLNPPKMAGAAAGTRPLEEVRGPVEIPVLTPPSPP